MRLSAARTLRTGLPQTRRMVEDTNDFPIGTRRNVTTITLPPPRLLVSVDLTRLTARGFVSAHFKGVSGAALRIIDSARVT